MGNMFVKFFYTNLNKTKAIFKHHTILLLVYIIKRTFFTVFVFYLRFLKSHCSVMS
uniref:Uncharacterized protein n=1 Tax=Meloidogyne enterolobii TaxID=390850 RepID=A0A6V7VSU1_MELEN|nr:unnamed protein product [Meloidogyne enterolobii]